jgi:glycosyltransferase involved in cell wall biosynthesis
VESVPPLTYGGTERVVASLADALVDRGHDVTLFASGDSRTRARLEPIVERSIWHDDRFTDPLPFWTLAIDRAYRHAGELEVMHNHADYFAYARARVSPVPTVTTAHGRLDLPELREVYSEFREMPLVSISLAQRRPLPEANWVANIAHGYPLDLYRPSYERGTYLAFCGRFSKDKGIAPAVEVARRTGIPLKVAARRPRPDRVEDGLREEWEYWDSILRDLIAGEPLVEYLGELGEAEKQELYAGAAALLFPIDWPEPFGLVMIEALACGTPVLARPRGSVPEVIRDGVTGYICETIDEFVEAVGRIDRIDRRECRAEFERRFTADVMAAQYEGVFERLAAREPIVPLPLRPEEGPAIADAAASPDAETVETGAEESRA